MSRFRSLCHSVLMWTLVFLDTFGILVFIGLLLLYAHFRGAK
jgi:hypothetical protein